MHVKCIIQQAKEISIGVEKSILSLTQQTYTQKCKYHVK